MKLCFSGEFKKELFEMKSNKSTYLYSELDSINLTFENDHKMSLTLNI